VYDPVEILQRLIAIPSVNPMGKAADPSLCFESRLTDFLAERFSELDLPHERHEVHPGRENILARLESTPSRPTLVLEVHQDTVPVDGMTIDPFSGELRRGRVYGRGACDVKGAMACILAAASRLLEQRPPNLPNIVIACTVNEEHGFSGAQKLAELFKSGQSRLLPTPPDAVIVSEPTELNVVVAHKGVVRWRYHTRGKAAHSSDPTRGVNAIYRMMDALAAVTKFAEGLEMDEPPDPLLGRRTFNVGTIHGGISVNTVPDHCVVEIDYRLLPGDDPHDRWQDACQRISSMVALGDRYGAGEGKLLPEHDEPYITARGLSGAQNGDLAKRLIACVQAAGGASEAIGVPFGTDASAFGMDVPTVVFGPGSIAQAHTDDEWIAVEQLRQATDVLVEFCRQFSG